jgi:hypothetical protein
MLQVASGALDGLGDELLISDFCRFSPDRRL